MSDQYDGPMMVLVIFNLRAEIERLRQVNTGLATNCSNLATDNIDLRAEVEALRSLLAEAREGVDMIGCSPEGYDQLIKYRDTLLAKIDAALRGKGAT